jgi:hypothetical protein
VTWGAPREPEPRPDTTAAGNSLLWFFGSIAVFGGFLVAVPGAHEPGGAWLWIGLALLVPGAVGFGYALRARLDYRRRSRDG